MILVSTQCFPPATGGIETLMHSLCLALERSGHELMVFADGGRTARAADRQLSTSGIHIRRYTGFKPWRRRRKARDIARFARHNPVQGLLADSWKSLEFTDPEPFSRVLCLAHGSELPPAGSPGKAVRIRSALNKASIVIANSGFTAARVEHYLAGEKQLSVIHPGIEPPPPPTATVRQQVSRQLEGRGPVLISIARLDRRKGQYRVLEILPELLQQWPGLLYVIVGDGPYRTPLREQAGRLGLDSHVLFTGTRLGGEKTAYLEASDVFIMPCDSGGEYVEGFGIAYLEAASLGIPAIAGRSGGSIEAVLDGETGLICQAEDRRDLLEKAQRLLGDRELHRRLGDNARRRSRQFQWDRVVKQYEHLLDL